MRARLSYDDYKLDIGYSKNLDDFDDARVNGRASRSTIPRPPSSLLLTDMTLVGESERVQGEVYEADYKFAIDKIVAVGTDKAETTIEGIHYQVTSSVDDGFMDVGAKLGTGKMRHSALAELEFDIDEVHYDFTLRRLHAETLDKLMTGIKAAYSKPVSTVADVDAVMMTPIKEHGLALLKHDPEFVIDRIGIVTPEGEGVIKGVVRLKGMDQADFASGLHGVAQQDRSRHHHRGGAEADREDPQRRHRRRAWPSTRDSRSAKVTSSSATSNSRRASSRSTARPREFRDLAAAARRRGDAAPEDRRRRSRIRDSESSCPRSRTFPSSRSRARRAAARNT